MMKNSMKAGVRALAGLVALAAISFSLPALAAGSTPQGKVNVNTATMQELQLLPGIGESRAEAMIEARKQRGGFESIEDLLEVSGIGERSLERLRPHVTLKGKTTARAE
jgi:comEA protein